MTSELVGGDGTTARERITAVVQEYLELVASRIARYLSPDAGGQLSTIPTKWGFRELIEQCEESGELWDVSGWLSQAFAGDIHGAGPDAWRRAAATYLRERGVYSDLAAKRVVSAVAIADDWLRLFRSEVEDVDVWVALRNVEFEEPPSLDGLRIEKPPSSSREARRPAFDIGSPYEECLDRISDFWCIRAQIQVPARPVGRWVVRDPRPIALRVDFWKVDPAVESELFALALWDWSSACSTFLKSAAPLALLDPVLHSSHPWSWYEQGGWVNPLDAPECNGEEGEVIDFPYSVRRNRAQGFSDEVGRSRVALHATRALRNGERWRFFNLAMRSLTRAATIDGVDQFLSNLMCVESLISENKAGLTALMKRRVKVLLGEKAAKRFDELYQRRSKLVHGEIDSSALTEADLVDARSIARSLCGAFLEGLEQVANGLLQRFPGCSQVESHAVPTREEILMVIDIGASRASVVAGACGDFWSRGSRS